MRSSLRVNPSTLAVEFELPLANYPGRGGLNVPVTLRYSSKVWRIAYQSYRPSVQSTFDGQFLEGFTSLFAQFNGGWTSSVGIPAIMHDDDASRYNLSGMPLPETTDCDHTPCYRIDRMFFRMPDNTVHELRSSDEPYNISNSIVLPIPTPDDLYAVDGSGLRYQRSTQTLFLPDGSRYILNTANPSYVDRNGNTITFNADSPYIRDTGWGPTGVVNGDRKSLNWGNGGGWADAAPVNSFPDWLQVLRRFQNDCRDRRVYTAR